MMVPEDLFVETEWTPEVVLDFPEQASMVIVGLKRQVEEAHDEAEQSQCAYEMILDRFAELTIKSNELSYSLTTSQAREARLREALEWLNARIVTADLGGVVEKALALQHDDTAIREYRDVVIDECAKAIYKMKGAMQ